MNQTSTNSTSAYRYYIVAYVLLALVVGFLLGRMSEDSSLIIKNSILDSDAKKTDEFREENKWLDEYEITPEKMAEFVEENADYSLNEDGTVTPL